MQINVNSETELQDKIQSDIDGSEYNKQTNYWTINHPDSITCIECRSKSTATGRPLALKEANDT